MDRAVPARDGAELARRMRWFIADEARGGPEVSDLIGHLGQLGEVAIFGGMPRDLASGGAAAFNSDIDLVVDAGPERLAELLRHAPARRNRFGGYRIAGRHFDYDVWALPSTWAVRSGHVAARHLPDLVHTTFFDCDAVVYLCGSHRVHHAGRRVGLREGDVVEVNLEANPNPRGIVERAMRILLDRRHAPGPRLMRYLKAASASPGGPLTAEMAARVATLLAPLSSTPARAAAGRSGARDPFGRFRARDAHPDSGASPEADRFAAAHAGAGVGLPRGDGVRRSPHAPVPAKDRAGRGR